MKNSQQNFIRIKGAKVHNLKNVDVDIPRNKLVVITGVSGSGKSSLAFDTLYAEGQRRYVESLSTYARQFLGVMDKPDVEKIEGISPAISIDQRKASHNPRSTVGTITEIYDYLRVLFARAGKPHCPKCGRKVEQQSVTQIADQVLGMGEGAEITILGPVIRGRKGEHMGVLQEISRSGFVRVRIDRIIHRLEEMISQPLDKKKRHDIEVVVDRLMVENGIDRPRLIDSLEISLKLGKGLAIVSINGKDILFSEHFACEHCGISLPEVEPRLFSFNSPYGACPSCHGLGEKLEVDPDLVIPNKNLSISEGAIFAWAHASHKIGRQGYYWQQLSDLARREKFSLEDPVKDLSPSALKMILFGEKSGDFEGVVPNLERRYHQTDSEYTRQEIEQYMVEKICEDCRGKRLRPEALAVTVQEKSIDDITSFTVQSSKEFFRSFQDSREISRESLKIVSPLLKEILGRLQFLSDVGLDYLSLNRRASTLSGGEEQRIRLATQLGSQLTGVLYILDEPSIGLHSRDQDKLIAAIKKLRDLENTVVVVEHDPETIKEADWVIDVGPGAGKNGGKIVFTGTPKDLLKSNTLTGEYISGKKKVNPGKQGLRAAKKIKNSAQNDPPKFIIVKGAKEHNLKNIDAKIPLGKFVSVTGVSGSGKSTLVNDIIARALLKKFYRAKEEPGQHEDIQGVENLNKVVLVDQSAIGRTPRSNPATYIGAFSYIRDLFAKTKEAQVRGYDPGRFSFNVKGGRCESCEGQGVKKIEMYFLSDIYVECEVCKGTRYNKEALEIEFKGKNIAEVLAMTVEEARIFFKSIPGLYQKLDILNEVGLGYIELGQPAPSLSGGEAQRVKLAAELSRKSTGKTLYILDEPTTGLHPDDIKKLLLVLRSLVNQGNTVLVIEHNIDVVKNSDWVIDLGPEGGDKGGEIVAEGSPSEIKKTKRSYTGLFLKGI